VPSCGARHEHDRETNDDPIEQTNTRGLIEDGDTVSAPEDVDMEEEKCE